jgi:predicted molibdopterin-dependent oxidoreductase YjgC
MSIELMLASARRVPLIRDLAAEYGVSEPRFEMPEDDCILCALCVRACRELVGIEAISLANRGIEKAVSTPFQIASARCIECGMCVYVCPTGAIQLAEIRGRGKAGGDGRDCSTGSTSLNSIVEPSSLQDKKLILRPAVVQQEAQMGSSA